MSNAIIIVVLAACFGLPMLQSFLQQQKAVHKVGSDTQEAALWQSRKQNISRGWVETISWKPRAFVYHNFLTEEECDHILNKAKPLMKRSTVFGPEGKGVTMEVRTSYGAFLGRKQDEVIQRIEERVAEWTKLPLTHQEDMQVLRYAEGQQYKAHYDSQQNGKMSPRVATVLIYLRSTDLEGGETAFPNGSQWVDGDAEAHGPFSKCAEGHVAIKPKKGDAMLFFTQKPDSTLDRASMHTGCPVISGVKWTATKWIHTLPYHPERLASRAKYSAPMVMPEDCKDAHAHCSAWAASGECEKNPVFMKGNGGPRNGVCRLACGDCEACMPDDAACRAQNRERAGFLPLNDLD